MAPGSVRVTFEPPGVTVAVPAGTTVLQAARQAGVPLASTCGGRGTCGDCAVRVVAGHVEPPSATEADGLAGAPPDVRLSCLLGATSDMTVRPIAPLAQTVHVAAAQTPAEAVACAVDLGTTTVSAALLDGAGMELGEASAANPQRVFGGDVASRISAALAGEGRELQSLAMRGMGDALSSSGAALEGVGRCVIASNTAMEHLALAADVAGLATHPYEGVLEGVVRTTAARLGLVVLPPAADVLFLPPMAAFVGGDATAGVIATDLDRSADARILLDLGTNAEVVVSRGGELVVASAAAGPAFEAAGLTCGGAAAPGAVRDVSVESGEIALDVVAGGEACSLCGSGALALVSALLDTGHLDASGRMSAEGPLAARFHRRGDVLAFQISGEPGGERDVYLTQLDVRELQLAKAAVATALELTLASAGVGWTDVSEVMLAGAFGAGLDVGVLRRIGVLPRSADVPVIAAGDAALAGALIVAADAAQEARAEEVAAGARGVDLAADPKFHAAFIARTALQPS